MARPIRTDLLLNEKDYVRGLRNARREGQRFTDHTHRAGSAVKTAFAAFSAATVVLEMRKWVGAARDANRVAAQTNAVIKSTRGATNLSAKGFADLAKQIMRTTAVDDDLIQGGENILATFTKIKAGGPEKIFERATAAAVDMTAGLNQGQVSAEGLKSANLLLGKALQEPVTGLGKLQRAGVSFSAAQKDQIKRFVEHGQVAKAQGIIISEVNRQFGGSAAAAVTPAKRLAVTWGNMQEVLGNLLIPTIDRGAVVMTNILEVVDRNRTAFGILVAVLAAGAAIIGTLVVASKIHRAVTEAVTVATEVRTAVQKGLNLVLGTTSVQATTAAAAEGTLATATTASGVAAQGAALKYAAAARVLGLWAAGLALAVSANEIEQRTSSLGARIHANVVAPAYERLGIVSKEYVERKQGEVRATQQASGEAKDNTDALGDLIPKQQQAAEKTAAVTQKTTELTGKLKELKQGFKDQVAAVRESILSYEGLVTQSDVTAAQVVKDLNTQVRNFQTYSVDVKRLIKAGVSPAAIEELSKKGPQFVHALATGSNRELQTYKSYWRDRQREIKGAFATSMQQQYEGLVKKIKAMQREINKLKGKTILITGALKLSFSPSFSQKDWVQVRLAAGRMATGGRVGGQGPRGRDNQLRWLAPDEHVWTGREVVASGGHAAMERWRKATLRGDVPGLAAGGPVGQIDAQARAVNKVQAWGTSRRMDAGLTNLLKLWTPSAIPHTPGSWKIATDYLRRLGIAFNIISTFRPGARTRASGSVSFHALNRAVDLTGNMMAIFNALTRTNPTELIYSRTSRYKSRSEWHPIGRLDPITRADHFSHVHAAYDKGGWLPPGTSIATNRTGRPEMVLAAGQLEASFRRPLQSWVVPWLKRIALGVERGRGGGVAAAASGARAISAGKATSAAFRRLTAQQLNRLPDAARWAYVGAHGRPTPPAGFAWAEDHSLVPTSFWNKTSFDRGGWLQPGATLAVNRTGRSEPVGFDYDRLAAVVGPAVAAAVAQALHGVTVDLDGQAVGALVVEPQFRDLRRLLRSSGRPSR